MKGFMSGSVGASQRFCREGRQLAGGLPNSEAPEGGGPRVSRFRNVTQVYERSKPFFSDPRGQACPRIDQVIPRISDQVGTRS
jgi:hypothetical protein